MPTWRDLTARFDALSRRERGLVAAALLFGGGLLGYAFLVDPSLQRQADAAKRIVQAKNSMGGIAAQTSALQSQLRDPDAANRAALQQVQARLAALDAELRGLEGSLVSPEQMQAFLESLLSKNQNLELLTLRTLPLAPLIERDDPAGERPAEGKRAAAGAKPAESKRAAASAPNIYKHGVEIQIAGSYTDLLAYLTDLERMPQRIIWNRMVLSVEQYPRCVMTLTVYTLSLDKQWLVL